MIKESSHVKWEFTKDIPASKRKVDYKISIKYPDYSKWGKFTPEQRRNMISSAFQHGYERLIKHVEKYQFILTGKKSRPTGIQLSTSLLAYKKLKRQLPNFEFFIQKIQGARKKEDRKGTEYICFKALFQVQIEGMKNGNQTFEERFILIKSTSHQSAEKKLLKAFKPYEKPYLNHKGEFVRWKFESFEESYFVIDLEDPGSISGKNGVEVFSKLGSRRLKKNNIWNGPIT